MTSDAPAELGFPDGTPVPGAGRRTPPSLGLAGAAVVAGVGTTAIAIACIWSPAGASSGPEVCPFRLATGLPCPGCGLTRSWVSLMHGDVSAAFSFNAFGPLALAATTVAVVIAVWSLVTRSSAPIDRARVLLRARPVIAVAAVWIAYGIFRAVDAAVGWGIFPTIT
ncbi:hypothetical protein Gbro_3461 [Gordonia bronchialis DSM 43247]|uniref:DUF2752 domain-containing protein n=1 Tax=Gordonia bronchialis (strain ATCC 25592 / DSM 43247 / BCRC 13721 / JCM 3198 / KCTC 3076 / NBRC 16047 / NCTC 10667) TaxID=526226 RepID=D0LE63_GORB4|nr:DUF2752 domain-containing protein [Gordonia bronchialis]ACY22655.1 hypothetical protein Gbro_3461 [Gordonia bronchialis DSM 43247]MCC3325437.1 DUF2752 domain-containing protein [Gordonia bronchialis]STQ65595.1 Protein of uncharacterised function (DUF2752) [Gordonia bronchialis]